MISICESERVGLRILNLFVNRILYLYVMKSLFVDFYIFGDLVLHLRIMRSLFADLEPICRFVSCLQIEVSSFSTIMALFCHKSETIVSEF